MHTTSYWLFGLPVSRLGVGYVSIRQKDVNYRFSPAKAYWAHGDAGGSPLDHQMSCSDYPSGCAHTSAKDFAQLMVMMMNLHRQWCPDFAAVKCETDGDSLGVPQSRWLERGTGT